MIKNKTQLLYLLLNGTSLGISVVYAGLLARLLGPDFFGQYSVLQNIGFLLVPLSALVPNLVFATAYGSHAKDRPASAGGIPIASSLLRFVLLLSLLTLPIASAVLFYLPVSETSTFAQKLLALFNIYAGIQLLVVQSFYQINNSYTRFLLTQAVSMLAKMTVLGLFGYALTGVGLNTALAVNLAVTILWTLGGIFDLGLDEAVREPWVYFAKSKRILGPSLAIAMWAALMHSLDILMAQRNFNAVDLSVYAVISSISKVTIILPSAITPLVLESGYRDRAIDHNSDRNSDRNSDPGVGDLPTSSIVKSVGLTIAAGLMVSLIGHFAAPFLLPLLFQRSFDFQGWPILAATLAMTLLAIISFYVHYDFGRGRYMPLMLSCVATLAIFIAFNCLPQNLGLSHFCLFLLAWPLTNAALILGYNFSCGRRAA